jgi:uncharacterized protein YndB with AHSA1/START domain
MERKTQVHAEDGRQELIITREFDLPRTLLFSAYTDPEIFGQWMGTNVRQLECRAHGSYRFETTDAQGNVVFSANGLIHEFVPEEKITRTFLMENSPFAVQLEFLEFEALTEDTSRLTMHIVFRSITLRDQLLQMPFAYGLNMAHNRLQESVEKIK